MPRSTRKRVKSLVRAAELDDNNSVNQSATEHTGFNDSPVPLALYDLDPDDPRSPEYVRGRRESRPTERNVQYRGTRSEEESKRSKSADTRAKNKSRRAKVQVPPTPSSLNLDGGRADTSIAETVPDTRGRGRSRAIRPLSLSPSPGSTDREPEPTQGVSGESAYTYVYEDADHQQIVDYARTKHNLDVQTCDDTQTIVRRVWNAEAEQASKVGPTQRPAEIVVLSPSPIQVNGGWSQDIVPSQSHEPSRKRPADQVDGSNKRPRRSVTVEEVEDVDAYVPGSGLSEGSSKRLLEEVADLEREAVTVDDTATESETSAEVVMDNNSDSARVAAEKIACPSCLTNFDPTRPPQRGTRPPPPTCDATPATVLDPQLASRSSLSLGDPIENPEESNIPKLPNLFSLVSGPVHARLRAKLLNRWLKANSCPANDSEAPEGPTDPQTVESHSTDSDEAPEAELGSVNEASHRATHGSSPGSRTYAGSRSHVPSGSRAPPARPTQANTSDDPIRPNSPNLTPAELIQRERARAAAAKADTERTDMGARRHRPLVANASQAPTYQPQTRPPVGGRGTATGRRMGGPRCLDPISAAREDMRAFNQAVAQGEATSFVQSVTRQSERTARHRVTSAQPVTAER